MGTQLELAWAPPAPQVLLGGFEAKSIRTHKQFCRTFSSSRVLHPAHRRAATFYASVVQYEDPTGTRKDEKWGKGAVSAEHMLAAVNFNDAGLVPAIAQQWNTGEVLMMAYMNANSIRETMRIGRAVYYSRSRRELWRKGDTSGQIQVLRAILLDCDGDTILLKVDQRGVACHTGRRTCFYTAFGPPSGEPKVIAEVLMDPKELYKETHSDSR